MSTTADIGHAGNACFSLIASGDHRAFSRLYDRFSADTFGQCCEWATGTADSGDAMAEVWMYLWRNAATLSLDARSTAAIVRAAASDVIGDRVMRRLAVG